MKKLLYAIAVGLLMIPQTVFAIGGIGGITYPSYMTPDGSGLVYSTGYDELGTSGTPWEKIYTVDLDVSGVFTFSGVMGGDLDMLGYDILNVGALTGSGTFLPVGTGNVASTHSLSDANDLLVEGALEVNGDAYFDDNVYNGDGLSTFFGDGNDAGFRWGVTDQTNDSFMFFVETGSSAESGNIIFTEASNRIKDHDLPIQTNPTISIFSSTDPDTANDQWLSMYHDTGTGVVATGTGGIAFVPFDGNTTFYGMGTFSADVTGDDTIVFQTAGGDNMAFFTPYTDDGLHLGVRGTEFANNNFILTTNTNRAKDHDHDTLSTHPTLFIHSNTDPDSDNTQWLSLTHDQTDAVISAGGNSNLVLTTEGGGRPTAKPGLRVQVASGGTFSFINVLDESGNAAATVRFDADKDQTQFGLNSVGGRAIVFGDYANREKDYDHAVQTNPTVYVHSATDPDTDNTQWGSLAHNQTDFVISTGTGAVAINGNQKIDYKSINQASYEVTDRDYYLGVVYTAAGGAVTIVLPDDLNTEGTTFIIKDEGLNAAANNITIDPEGATLIDGAATYDITSDGDSYWVVSNGSGWYIN